MYELATNSAVFTSTMVFQVALPIVILCYILLCIRKSRNSFEQPKKHRVTLSVNMVKNYV